MAQLELLPTSGSSRISRVAVSCVRIFLVARGMGVTKPVGMPTVACVVITKNEERNIADCLGSVQWANELIVVDT